MMNKGWTLIIPSAKIVPEELQNLGKLPGVIYPINQKIVFDYQYEQYKNICNEIKIICYEKAGKIHRRLEKYKNKNVILEDLPLLEDLGHSIYYGIKNIDNPVIINFADTIVLDDISKIDRDGFFYAEDYMSDTWTFFEEEKGNIVKIYDKIPEYSEVQKKLFVGVFKISDPEYFKMCLEEAFSSTNRTESTFFYAIRLYNKKYVFDIQKTDNWFDIGHVDKYYNSNLEVKAREFNHITIDRNRGILKKSSDDKEKFIGEIKWYLKLPSDIEYVRPRIFDYSTSYVNPFVSMEYYAYHTVHELFLYGDLNYHQWVDIFKRIAFVCTDFKRYTIQDTAIKEALEDIYLTKTLQRFEKMKSDERFCAFFNQSIMVNGKKYKSLSDISEILKKVVPEMLYDVEYFNIIHGDLCFSNIMVDSNFSFIKVIDPRGKFGKYDIYGDPRYELAKLFHSVDGKYDFIIKDLFNINYDLHNAEIKYQIIDRKRDYDLYKVFTKVFKDEIGEDLKKIELIESLLFFSMIPLHGENINHQLAMLGTGIEILNRVTEIEEN